MNSVTTRMPALLWPFSQNREQRLRAERLADRGLLTMLKDEDLLPDCLAALMDQKMTQSTRPTVTIDLDGAANTVTCIDNWLKNSG